MDATPTYGTTSKGFSKSTYLVLTTHSSKFLLLSTRSNFGVISDYSDLSESSTKPTSNRVYLIADDIPSRINNINKAYAFIIRKNNYKRFSVTLPKFLLNRF